jgi:hypothetical protein
MENDKIEVDGQEYDAETVGEAMTDGIIGRAPVTVMSNQTLRDEIGSRLRWALGAVTLIATSSDTADESIEFTADGAALHLQQARDMFRELDNRMYPPKPRPDAPVTESRQNAE